MAIEGAYEIPLQTPLGLVTIALELRMEGSALCGCTRAFNAEASFSGGSVIGNRFKFTVTEQTPIGCIDLEYSGFVDGDKISGQVITPRGNKSFAGTRI